MRSLSLSLHIIGIVFWLGSLLLIPRLLCFFAELQGSGEGTSKEGEVAVRRKFGTTYTRFMWLGLALVTLSGLLQVFLYGVGTLMKEGWFHGKLTLVIGLYILTFFTTREVGFVANGGAISKGRLMMFHGVSGLLLAIIVFLTLGRVL